MGGWSDRRVPDRASACTISSALLAFNHQHFPQHAGALRLARGNRTAKRNNASLVCCMSPFLQWSAGLAVIAALYYWTSVSRVLLFWAAFILTRPLGAMLGDLLDKPLDHGGLALSRPIASVVIAAMMIGLILLIPQRQVVIPHQAKGVHR